MSAPTTDRGGIRQTMNALKEAGWLPLWVDDGGDEDENVKCSTTHEVEEAVTAVDDAFVVVEKGTERGWVRFVLGNSPDEVVCDYTVKLDEALDPMFDRWNA